jgi:hypothetical protein
MVGTITYDGSAIQVVGGTEAAPAGFIDVWNADKAGTLTLLASFTYADKIFGDNATGTNDGGGSPDYTAPRSSRYPSKRTFTKCTFTRRMLPQVKREDENGYL